MNEWLETTLGELCEDISYGYTASASTEKVGPRFLRITDIVSGRLNWETIPYCEITNDKRQQYLLEEGDIVIARTGATTGATYTWKNTDDYNTVYASYLIRYKLDKKRANPKFVDFLLRSNNWAMFVESIKGGSAQPGANAKQFASYDIFLPPMEEQKAITAVLASLDDKINLLHRQNKTLESLAQTLFRHWFIEEPNDKWKEGYLGDVAENVRDSAKHDQVPSGTIYIGLEHIDKKRIALNNHGLSDDINSNKYWFKDNDILFGKLRPYFHKVCFAPFSGICSTDILVLRPKKPHYFCFCLFAFFQDDVIEFSNFASGGTRMPRVNWKTLSEYAIAIPSDEAIKQFNNLVYPAIEKIRLNLNQIRTLEKLRDTLLPKLMSGEVRVRQN